MIDPNWETVFKKRLEENYDELKWLYYELYHDEQAFDDFCLMLHQYYRQRRPALKALDETRLAHPDWYGDQQQIGEMMYTQCFNKTLRGVKDQLDYLLENHIRYLHLMPLLESPQDRSDGGYAVADYRKIQPELGTMEDLADLADACHQHHISLCLDFVMNHTSEDHEWAKRAKAGEKAYQDRYFFFDNWNIPKAFEKTKPEVFPATAPGNFTWCEEAKKVVMTTFYPYQWDLNYANSAVFNDMMANLFYLCNQGADVIRLDALPYIWKTLGTTCQNLPQVHTIVRIMHIAISVVCPGTLLLGEVVMEPSSVVPYFGTKEQPECDLLYNVTTMCTTWQTVATKDVRLLRHQLETTFALDKQDTFLNYLRCHDDISWDLDYDFLKQEGMDESCHKKYLNDYFKGALWESQARGELYNDDPQSGNARICGTTASLCGIEAAVYEENKWKLKMAIDLDVMLHAFLLTLSGIPVIYSGDEIGQLNDYSYHDDPLKKDDARYLQRGTLNWDQVALRHDASTRQGALYQAIVKLTKIRSSYRVFDTHADTWIVETWNDHVLGMGRYYQQEKLIALFNFADHEQTAWVNDDENYIDLMSGEMIDARAVKLPAHGFVWLFHSFKPQPVMDLKLAAKRAQEEAEEATRVAQAANARAMEKKKEAEKAQAAFAEAQKESHE